MNEYIIKTMPDGSHVSVRDVQMVLLEMLKDIDALCRKYEIPYYLSGGSCLGAVRHKGFIPWDDDADICMMREDYERFQKVINELDPNVYYSQDFDRDPKYNVLIPAMKIRKHNTYCKEGNPIMANKCKGDGVFIDVFIADYVSESKWKDRLWRIYQIVLMVIISAFEFIRFNPLMLKRHFVKNAKRYGEKNKNSSLIGYEMTWTFNFIRKPVVYKKEDIYPVQYMEFEDAMLPVPKVPKSLLDVEISVNHMSYPPLKDQKPKHLVDVDLHTSNH